MVIMVACMRHKWQHSSKILCPINGDFLWCLLPWLLIVSVLIPHQHSHIVSIDPHWFDHSRSFIFNSVSTWRDKFHYQLKGLNMYHLVLYESVLYMENKRWSSIWLFCANKKTKLHSYCTLALNLYLILSISCIL